MLFTTVFCSLRDCYKFMKFKVEYVKSSSIIRKESNYDGSTWSRCEQENFRYLFIKLLQITILYERELWVLGKQQHKKKDIMFYGVPRKKIKKVLNIIIQEQLGVALPFRKKMQNHWLFSKLQRTNELWYG